MSYSHSEVYQAALTYFHHNELAASVWSNKYCLQKDNEYFELTPDDTHRRLAREFARIDGTYGLDIAEREEVYYQAQKNFERVLAQGSPLTAIGNPYQLLSASNCVVVESPRDSMEGIITTGLELAQLCKRRCGCGVDISTLRPEGMPVNNAAKTTSGAWSFADFFSYVIRMTAQNGRRGALMLTLNVHHPDVEKFATMKRSLEKVTGANISVRLTDVFLRAVEQDQEYTQAWPCPDSGKEPKFTRQVKARQVWDTIVESATLSAEPGLIFWDRMTQYLPADSYPDFHCKSCNPCSEIALSSYDSCRLMSINLTGYVRSAFDNPTFDWELFVQDVATATQMLDNLVDLEIEMIQRIIAACDSEAEKELWRKLEQSGRQGRRIGLGTTGLADAFAQLNIRYDSDAALDFAQQVYTTQECTAYLTSIDLAKARGPFPVFDWAIEQNNLYIQSLPDEIKKRLALNGRRNIAILTQAPTGSISIIAKCGEFDAYNVSSGVEPIFRNSYTRRKKVNSEDEGVRVDYIDASGDKWQNFDVYHSNAEMYLKKTGEQTLPDFFVTSDQINWKQRLALQNRLQQHIDHSISSTINLPRGTTKEQVGEIYLEAWKAELKGITVYVDGSRDGVLLTKDDEKIDKISRQNAPKRPKELPCEIHHHTVNGQKWIALVGMLNNEPYEFFAGFSDAISIPKRHKTGKIVKHYTQYNLHIPDGDDDELVIKSITQTFSQGEIGWATRLMSMSLRHGVPIDFLVEQLQKEGNVTSLNKVMARVMKKYIADGKVRTGELCSNCQSASLVWQEGCVICTNCGNGKCS